MTRLRPGETAGAPGAEDARGLGVPVTGDTEGFLVAVVGWEEILIAAARERQAPLGILPCLGIGGHRRKLQINLGVGRETQIVRWPGLVGDESSSGGRQDDALVFKGRRGWRWLGSHGAGLKGRH